MLWPGTEPTVSLRGACLKSLHHKGGYTLWAPSKCELLGADVYLGCFPFPKRECLSWLLCVMNQLEASRLKMTVTYYFSQFCGSRIQVDHSWVLLLHRVGLAGFTHGIHLEVGLSCKVQEDALPRLVPPCGLPFSSWFSSSSSAMSFLYSLMLGFQNESGNRQAA